MYFVFDDDQELLDQRWWDMSLVKLEKKGVGFLCPKCGGELNKISGNAVSIVNGTVDMSTTLPKFACDNCGIYYQELLNSGYYDEYPWTKPQTTAPKPKPKRVIRTGDIQPTVLKREADGKCPCPRCGERMDFVEAGPVQIVNGRPDFSNTMDHFNCPYCKSVFRKIVGTDYFQWFDK